MKIIAGKGDAVGFSLQIARSAQDTVDRLPIHRGLGVSLLKHQDERVQSDDGAEHVNSRWQMYVEERTLSRHTVPNPEYGGNPRT